MQGIVLSVARSRTRLRNLMPGGRSTLAALAFAGLGTVAGADGALAQPAAPAQGAYEFAAPPSAQANRVYGLNRQTGEMNVCQFERPEGSAVGITHCFAQGEGAGPQKAGSYALAPTHYEGETGIFRVNRDTGEMSICYVRETARPQGGADSSLVCTPAAR
ncbi:hypothetical protein Xaut_3220 [Xanthobacter versatilis]|uniref:Uncharacterized protein n=1 Tax=Xanthobacter autotrophicus (strain ATCC BAA-1158 / Py2) TaxID=78245 RepID=A7IKA6_XANP2|nr:hypothetical protein Xaut_3220 [Xanthobacter autotrophicus Py2]